MNITIYQYPQCSTCRSAVKWLKNKGYEIDSIHIVENPPTAIELAEMVKKSGLELKKFFNTSGVAYKEMNLKDKVPAMTDDEKMQLLASNGMLIKRPIMTDSKKATIGFKLDEMEKVWG